MRIPELLPESCYSAIHSGKKRNKLGWLTLNFDDIHPLSKQKTKPPFKATRLFMLRHIELYPFSPKIGLCLALWLLKNFIQIYNIQKSSGKWGQQNKRCYTMETDSRWRRVFKGTCIKSKCIRDSCTISLRINNVNKNAIILNGYAIL